ncbi:MAG TPA: hypothetical protein V6D11_00010 [Waterburya sp.]|jgi:hypothetical protein
MAVSNVAMYTLAALTASAFSDKSQANSGLAHPESALDANNWVESNNIKKEPATAKHAIAPPEMLEEPEAITSIKGRVRADKGARGDGNVGNSLSLPSLLASKEASLRLPISTSRQASIVPTDIFTSYLEQIRKSLPPGLVMRLPSQVSESDNWDVSSRKYSVIVSPSVSQPGLTVSVFSCGEPQPSCLVGSFAATAKSSLKAQGKFKHYQAVATPIALPNKIQGYLLEESQLTLNPELPSVMWEQDNQFYTVTLHPSLRHQLLNIANSMAETVPIENARTRTETSSNQPVILTAAEESAQETEDVTKNPATAELLQHRHPTLTTAEQLRQGEVITNLRYRQYFPPGTGASVGLTGQPTFGINWGVTDNLELTLDAQTVDNSGPIRQGPFKAQRINPDGTGPNFFQEFTLQGKQRLWQNEEGTLALSGVAAASLGNAGRPFRFFTETNPISNGQNHQIVPSLELPFTIKPDSRWQFTLSPKVAFLPDDNALYFNRLPSDKTRSFGTTFGLAGGISYQLNPRLILWGDAFVPLTGNNTINRETGLPTRTVAFNAGLRYVVNPRLATDLFVSNTLGNTGALSLVADRDYPSLGLGITYLPGITAANRRYSQHFGSTQQPPPNTLAGFALLDGGTVPNKQLLLSFQGGSQGLLTGFRYGLLDDFEIGAFLDSIPGQVDESELGVSGKIRFLHQADGDPFTLSGLVTVARANNVLINLISNNRNELQKRGLEKGGFVFGNEKIGEVLILTLSTPMHYQFKGGSAIWFTPTLGFVQRSGLDVAGLNLGGSVPLAKDLDVIAEAGLELSGKGNAFIGNKRETVIPWTVGFRWRPASVLGIPEKSAISGLQLEAYVTNRVGTTPFGSLRVRADNDLAIGAGLVLPIQF